MTTATPTATHDTACSSDMAGTPPSTKHLPIAARQPAEVVREYGPFGGASTIHGVTHDGQRVWAATGEHLVGFDPASGATTRTLNVVCDAGTAFDGTHLYQIAESRILSIGKLKMPLGRSTPRLGNLRGVNSVNAQNLANMNVPGFRRDFIAEGASFSLEDAAGNLSAPYADGWLFQIKASDEAEVAALLDAAGYAASIAE